MLKKVFLYVMVLFYILAGLNHFINPAGYEHIIPTWVPGPTAINYLSGACEIIFALLLIPVATRKLGAWLICTLLVIVFPANIQMSLNYLHDMNPHFWLSIVRLPLQGVLIWWAFQYTK